MQNESPGSPSCKITLPRPAPAAQAHQLPQRHVVEVGKTAMRAAGKALGFGVLRAWLGQRVLHGQQGTGKVGPGGKTSLRRSASARSSTASRCSGVGAQQPGGGRLVRDAVQGGKVGVAIKRRRPVSSSYTTTASENMSLWWGPAPAPARATCTRASPPARPTRWHHCAPPGRAKVGEFDFALFGQQHVGGLDVPVHQAFALGVLQRVAAFVGNVQHLRHGQQSIGTGKRRQRLPGHVFRAPGMAGGCSSASSRRIDSWGGSCAVSITSLRSSW